MMMTFIEMLLAALAALQAPKADEGGRPVLKYDDFKVIAEKNMFSPVKPKKPEKKVDEKKPDKKEEVRVEPPKPTLVRGLVEMSGAYCVLIEDTATKKAQFYKVGDSLLGGTIESVDKLKVTIKFGEEKKEYRNGEPLPLPKTNGSSKGDTTTTPAPTDEKKIEDIKADLRKKRGKKVQDEEEEEEKPKSGIKK